MTKIKRKIYISTDLEGASGVWRFAQTRDRTSPLFIQAVEYLMGDIAALVRGLREAGVSKITVIDGHSGGSNFIPHLMEPGAKYLTGQPRRTMEGLDKTYDGIILLGYHAMKGTPDGVLNHTQSSMAESRYWYNRRESGEIAQTALIAGSVGVPIIMVIGDVATCREAKRFLGSNVVTIATKRGISREAAELYPFQETRTAIAKGAKKALDAIAGCKPFKLKMPIHCKREWIEHTERPQETRVVVREASIRDVTKICAF
ncbi:MAG: M55 family metallopeptidase [Kiritimatiellae bacterium]|nr:M55 family metallopeptidase [Kiritimatiellia bacterium]